MRSFYSRRRYGARLASVKTKLLVAALAAALVAAWLTRQRAELLRGED